MFKSPHNATLLVKLKYLKPWYLSCTSSKGPVDDEIPWMPFEAIEYLEQICLKNFKVFEFGTGGSSLFFLAHASEVVSVEHDDKWFEVVSCKIKSTHSNRWKGYLKPPVLEGNVELLDRYKSSDVLFASHNFQDYCSAIDVFSDEYFDLILIDGRARVGCFLHAHSKVKKGGYIVLDNSERAEYQKVHDLAPGLGFEKIEFYGPVPYIDYQYGTTFYKKT